MTATLYAVGAICLCLFAHRWIWSDPDQPFFSFNIEKLKFWYKYNFKNPDWKNAQLPEIKLSALDHRQRITVIGFNDQGPVCRKTMHKTDHDEFVLIGYKCTEPYSFRRQVYEVQYCKTVVHLEYDPDRFIKMFTDPEPPKDLLLKENSKIRPVILAV